jgi:5-hydroxyisourate hydrolase-like protein (transthyretin family)
MKSTPKLLSIAALLCCGALAQAASITGTVTNKTTGKPAASDAVVLVDVQSGMNEVAKTTTDATGRYKLSKTGSGPYLVRVTHQGATYFIAAPEGNAAGDVPVYDVTAKVKGVYCEADVMEVETVNGQLRVIERYFVHNASQPPTTQWSARSFEIVLPAEAVVASVEAQRPSGLPTSLKLDPDGPKGHFAFNFPIQPDEGDKSTLFEISYQLPYSGKFTFKPLLSLPTQSVGVLMPKSMSFTAGAGSAFQPVTEDPSVQTFVARNATPGKPLEFTVSGSGSIPREGQGQQPEAPSDDQQASPSAGPGGGLGAPIGTPDPLTKYKGWILSALALLLAAGAAFLLRKPAPTAVLEKTATQPALTPATKRTALLDALKEELFALESERIAGSLTPGEYAEAKAALETVLKRALNRS